MKKILVLVLIFINILSLTAFAVSAEAEESFGIPELENAIPDSAKDLIGDLTVDEVTDTESLFTKIWDKLISLVDEIVANSTQNAVSVIVVSLFCGLMGSFAYDKAPQYINFAGVLTVATIAVGKANSVIDLANTALNEMEAFSHILLPCLCSCAAASGAVSSSAVKYAATAFFMDIFITLSSNVIFPLIYLFLAVKIAASALDNKTLEGVASLVKWLCTMSITIIISGFTLYLTMSAAISGSTDALTLKAAKTAMSTALPVVGGMLSDAASSVLAGFGILKGAVGVFGFIVVVAICFVPFLSLGIQYLAFKLAATISDSFVDGGISDLIGSISSAFGMALGVLGAGAFMLFLAIVSMIQVVNV